MAGTALNLPHNLPPGAHVRVLRGIGRLPAGAVIRPIPRRDQGEEKQGRGSRAEGREEQGQAPRVEGQADRPVLHGTDDVGELRASAERQAGKLGDAVGAAARAVPGADLDAVRSAKDSGRIEDKAARQGVAPSQVGDISAARVTAKDQATAEKVLDKIDDKLPVTHAEGRVVGGEGGKNGVRQVQAHVRLNQGSGIRDQGSEKQGRGPRVEGQEKQGSGIRDQGSEKQGRGPRVERQGEPVKSAEVLIQTPEMKRATDKTHDAYRKAQELRAAGDSAGATALETGLAEKHEGAEDAAQARLRSQGSENPGGGPSARGQGNPPSARDKFRAARERQKRGSGSHGPEAQGSGIRDQGSVKQPFAEGRQSTPVLVKDDEGQEQHATLNHFNPGVNGQKAMGRVTLANGFKMNVPAERMRPAAESAKGAEQQEKGWIGEDLDGTLAKYDGYKGPTVIGEPVPDELATVKQLLADGEDVRIFTARIGDDADGRARAAIEAWCLKHVGRRLPITNVKDDKMKYLRDDRAVAVERNTGKAWNPPPVENRGIRDQGSGIRK